MKVKKNKTVQRFLEEDKKKSIQKKRASNRLFNVPELPSRGISY